MARCLIWVGRDFRAAPAKESRILGRFMRMVPMLGGPHPRSTFLVCAFLASCDRYSDILYRGTGWNLLLAVELTQDVDILMQIGDAGGSVSQSGQWAVNSSPCNRIMDAVLIETQPFNAAYVWFNTSDNLIIPDADASVLNTYTGGAYQQATSVVTLTNQRCYELLDNCFSVYGFEVSNLWLIFFCWVELIAAFQVSTWCVHYVFSMCACILIALGVQALTVL